MSQYSAITNAALMYVSGLNVQWIDNLNAIVSPGQCRDSSNTFDIISNEPLRLSLSALGIGGLDVGVIAASQCYSIYLIASSIINVSPLLIASLSSNPLPLLPYNYQIYRRIGYATTSSLSVVNTYRSSGNNNDKSINLDEEFSISIPANAPAFTTLPLTTNFPPVPGMIGYIAINPVVDGTTPINSVVGVRGTGALGATDNTLTYLTMQALSNSAITAAWGYHTAGVTLVTGGLDVPSIDYSANHSAQIRIAGWIDSL